MTGAADRFVVAVVVLAAAVLVAWVLGARTRRRAAAAIAAAPGRSARILSFHADWCAACAAQRHQLEGLGTVEILHVDVEQDPGAARRHGIRSLPTTVVVGADGVVTAVNHGLVTTQVLRGQLGVGAGT